jgi:enterochelin esterase-like enzyme
MKKKDMKNNKQKLFLSLIVSTALLFSNSHASYSQDTNIPSPPKGYDAYNAKIAHGSTEVASYFSSTVGVTRKTRIYLPPGYTKDSTYNVLYLLHGIGGDINEWWSNGDPLSILDNLYARGIIAPMIVVMPNGRAMVDDSPGSNIYAADKVAGFANFEIELIRDLIPYIDTTYSVNPAREARAIAGLSMGAGQALNFGLAHLDTFAWVGAFSPAPNTKAANLLIPDLGDTTKISGLWISCGNADGLFYISQNTHNFLAQNNIKHYYLVEPGKGHEWSVWKPGLYHFTQRIFGVEPIKDTATAIVSPTDILQYKEKRDLKISYSTTEQTITILGCGKIEKMEICDINGRLMLSALNLRNNKFDINTLYKGVYLIVLFDGKNYMHGKFIRY